MEISAESSNILFPSVSSQMYIGLTNSSQVVQVKCTQNNFSSGTLVASVNSVPLTKLLDCNTYQLNSAQQSVCMQITATYTETITNGNFQLNFQCVINETSSTDVVNFAIYKTSILLK